MTDDTFSPTRVLRRTTRVLLAGAVAVAAGFSIFPTSTAVAVSDDDWLATVNTYRAMSGQPPVTENPTWSAEGRAHSCYMLQNGISHDEIPGKPGYTEGGDIAGNSGNVAVSSNIATTARKHVELWMTGPFHAIGVLRHNLRTSGFGLCAQENTPTPWRSGGTLDVIRGIDHRAPRPTSPIVFPGNGATVPLHSFITESPNPLTLCGWTGAAGLPLIAMMPNDVTSASTSLTGPDGPIETCALHRANTADPTAAAILAGDNAVVVMPREVLADGSYTATVNTNGGNVTWSFSVERGASLSATPAPTTTTTTTTTTIPTPDTELVTEQIRFRPVDPFRLVDSRISKGTRTLRGGRVATVEVAGAGVEAVSANFVAVDPKGHGFITVYNCTATRPDVSTVGFKPGEVVANQAVVPLEAGKLCIFSLVDTDIVIDVNGFFEAGGSSGFVPANPQRIHDSRTTGSGKLKAGREQVLTVAGLGSVAPVDARSVAMNVTVTETAGFGFLQVYPCGSKTAAEISTINYRPADSRPNSVVVPVNGSGNICVKSLTDTHVVIDFTGHFSDGGGADFQPLNPIRLFDSRSQMDKLNTITKGRRVGKGEVIRLQIAGHRGIPADATAVAVNLTATDTTGGSFLTAYPCGRRPDTSNVNIVPGQPVAANGAMVKLSSEGELCVFALDAVHVIVDVNGVYL